MTHLGLGSSLEEPWVAYCGGGDGVVFPGGGIRLLGRLGCPRGLPIALPKWPAWVELEAWGELLPSLCGRREAAWEEFLPSPEGRRTVTLAELLPSPEGRWASPRRELLPSLGGRWAIAGVRRPPDAWLLLARNRKESIYIRVNNPSLNNNIGKFNLFHIWDRVLLNTKGLTLK